MIVGTAGHIDHGKTSLVKALTGIDADRLAEEKRRGITIDLGFAYQALPNGEILGFVDVPGHERFVHNMLAGVSGIDCALLVVAADDGPMPQTVEHLQILDLLGIERAVVALTKKDVVSAERLAEAIGETRALLAETGLAEAEILPVSSVNGEGVADIAAWLQLAAEATAQRTSQGYFRLAVDRSFTLAGTGTVVTGTVVAGHAKVGDSLLVSPSGLEARLRGIHAQNRPAQSAEAGQRCALNVVGPRLSKEAIARGDWIVAAPAHAPIERFDALYRHLPGQRKPMRHWTPVRVHLGAAHVGGRVALLGAEALEPGQHGMVQIVLDRKIGALAGDRFILRDQSAQRTMGGGRLLDPFPPSRGRRTPQRLAILAALSERDAEQALAALMAVPPGWVDLAGFAVARNLSAEELAILTVDLPMQIAATWGFTPPIWDGLRDVLLQTLADFHKANPDLPGLQSERLRTTLSVKVPPAPFRALAGALALAKDIVLDGPWYRLPGHSVTLTAKDRQLWGAIEQGIRAERFNPPRVRDFATALGAPEAGVRQLLKRLARMGKVVEAAPDHFFLRETMAEMAARTLTLSNGPGSFTAGQFRDEFAIGRKVAIQILEYFDRQGVTLRKGDLRQPRRDRVQMFGTEGPRP